MRGKLHTIACALAFAPGLFSGPDAAAAPSQQALVQNYRTGEGRIRVVGYNDMDLMLEALAAAYSRISPGLQFEFVLEGTRTAPPALMQGHSAFAPMGAEFQPAAMAAYRERFGQAPVELRVAHSSLDPGALSGPLALFVHPENPLQAISLADTRRLFSGAASPDVVRTWGDLGLEDEWRRRPVRPCGLRPGTALANFLKKYALDDMPYSPVMQGFRQSIQAVEFAAGNPDALCFAAFNRGGPLVRALPVSRTGLDEAIPLSRDAVIADRYPLTRHLYIYIHHPKVAPLQAQIAGFLRFVLSREGQHIIASGPRGYLPLNDRELAEQRLKLN